MMYAKIEICSDDGTVIHQVLFPHPQRGGVNVTHMGPNGIVETDGYVLRGYKFIPDGGPLKPLRSPAAH